MCLERPPLSAYPKEVVHLFVGEVERSLHGSDCNAIARKVRPIAQLPVSLYLILKRQGVCCSVNRSRESASANPRLCLSNRDLVGLHQPTQKVCEGDGCNSSLPFENLFRRPVVNDCGLPGFNVYNCPYCPHYTASLPSNCTKIPCPVPPALRSKRTASTLAEALATVPVEYVPPSE